MGLLGSIADTIFEKITGRNVGDTVLAFLTGDDGPQSDPVPKNLARNTPATSATQTALATPAALPGSGALDAALAAHGVQSDLAIRARQAYSRTLSMTGAPATDVKS
jgi:hypothetical protein